MSVQTTPLTLVMSMQGAITHTEITTTAFVMRDIMEVETWATAMVYTCATKCLSFSAIRICISYLLKTLMSVCAWIRMTVMSGQAVLTLKAATTAAVMKSTEVQTLCANNAGVYVKMRITQHS